MENKEGTFDFCNFLERGGEGESSHSYRLRREGTRKVGHEQVSGEITSERGKSGKKKGYRNFTCLENIGMYGHSSFEVVSEKGNHAQTGGSQLATTCPQKKKKRKNKTRTKTSPIKSAPT